MEHAEVRSVGYLREDPRLLEPDLRDRSPGRRQGDQSSPRGWAQGIYIPRHLHLAGRQGWLE